MSFQVIYRVLSPWGKLDPYSSEARAQLGITNLRVRLLQPQPCPCQLKESNPSLLSVPYAISDFILKGACLCHGHSDQCVPASGYLATHSHGHHVVSEEVFVFFLKSICLHVCCFVPNKILNAKFKLCQVTFSKLLSWK